ncbi:MAG: hypothetical protein LC775_15260 [Acidobacteria bacterium]|nr:hypothetical protein [Acidobacteriota bacterium]
MLEHGRKHSIRGQPLDVDAHRLLDDVIGEARAGTRLAAPVGEGGPTRVAPEALERLELAAQADRSGRGFAVALGVQAQALRAPATAFSPRAPPLSSRLPDK